MYISEKVHITNFFEADPEVDLHVHHYSDKVEQELDQEVAYVTE